MPNDEFRKGGDGKGYPRLLVKKVPSSAFPWKVQKLYAQGPFAKKDLVHECTDSATAFIVAGKMLDDAYAALASRPKTPSALPLTFDDIRKMVSSPIPQQAHEFMGS